MKVLTLFSAIFLSFNGNVLAQPTTNGMSTFGSGTLGSGQVSLNSGVSDSNSNFFNGVNPSTSAYDNSGLNPGLNQNIPGTTSNQFNTAPTAVPGSQNTSSSFNESLIDNGRVPSNQARQAQEAIPGLPAPETPGIGTPSSPSTTP